MDALHIQTRVVNSTALTRIFGAPVFLKMETDQPTGSFKIRGIGALCQEWVRSGKTHLVSSSGGNAGYAVAYAGRKLGVEVTVFVPSTTRPMCLELIRSEGATVNVVGDVWDDANQAALSYAKQINAGFVHPFDHPTIWLGNASLIDEVVTQIQKPAGIIVAVGGGGLASGILQGLDRHGWQDVPLYCVEPEGAAGFAASLQAKHLVTLKEVHTVATSLATKCVTQELLRYSNTHHLHSLVVKDKNSVMACRRFADDHRVLVEPACGAALSVIYDVIEQLPKAPLLVIVCGGIGISIDFLAELVNRFAGTDISI